MQTASENAAAAVRAIADQEFQAMADGNVAAFLGLLAPDVAFFPPSTPPKSGSAVEPWIAEFLAGFSVKFQQWQHDETLLGAGWAVLRTGFRWQVAPRGGGEALVRMAIPCGCSGKTKLVLGSSPVKSGRPIRRRRGSDVVAFGSARRCC
jgi:hypothetical protein